MTLNRQGILDTIALLKAAVEDGRTADIRQHVDTIIALSDGEEPTVEDIIGSHSGARNSREWWSGGAWLYPGDDVVVLRTRRRT